MRIRTFVAPMLVAGAGAAAIAFAPLAAAATGPSCVTSGNASVCQSEGNAQITATPPPVDYQPMYPFFADYGLLYHHGGSHN